MKKVLLVDYLGHCNNMGKPIGHPVKALEEYAYLLSAKCQVLLAAPNNIIKEADLTNISQIIELPFYFSVDNNSTDNKYKMWKNIRKVINSVDYDYIWFFNVNSFLFKVLLLYPLKLKKTICTIYQQNFTSRLSNTIFDFCASQMACVICSLKTAHLNHMKSIYIPDFIYSNEKYEKYQKIKKQEKVVCLGTMSENKNLEELVDIFNKLGYPLEIAGHFREQGRSEELKKRANKNIIIQDRYLSNEEYLLKLSEAKYSVMPYDKKEYNNRTSGVLQECIFVNTIPITLNSILEANETLGIGVDSLNDLLSINLKEINGNEFFKNYEYRRINEFSEEIVRKKLNEMI